MKKALLIFIGLIFSVLWLSACSGTNPTPAADGQSIAVTLRTDPEIPEVGDIELQLDIKDAQGQPIEGATVDISADHTDMQGMTMSGLATAQGNGRYAITADFSMSGNWKIKVYIRWNLLDEEREFDLKVK